MSTREDACLHDSGCDGRSHSMFCNEAWFYPTKQTKVDVEGTTP